MCLSKIHIVGIVSMCLFSLIACNPPALHHDPITDEALREKIQLHIKQEKLKQIHLYGFDSTRQRISNIVLSAQEKQYVGRYQTVIDCEDQFVSCNQGTADFMLHLLEDGTAHRSVIHSGKITFHSAEQHRQDQWSYDSTRHQIILQRANGVKFFYDIPHEGQLQMNLEKTAHATVKNRAYFTAGYALPAKAYTLVKVE